MRQAYTQPPMNDTSSLLSSPVTRSVRLGPLARRLVATSLITVLCVGGVQAQCEVGELRGLEPPGIPLGGFGFSVSLSGDTAFVGSWHEDNQTQGSGAVYAFERTPAGWRRTARMVPEGGIAHFATVAVNGDRAAASSWKKSGLGGEVYFYDRRPPGWQQVGRLTASDLEWDDEYGMGVAIEGDTAVVGSPKDDDFCPADPQCNSGSVYVYERRPAGWFESAKLVASDPGVYDYFGVSVALEADRIAVGAFSTGSPHWPGAIYIFERQAGNWIETAKLVPSDGTGSSMFGQRVSLSGDVVVSGASLQDGKGKTYVFENRGGGWVEAAQLVASDGQNGDFFGDSVAIDGDRILVGAPDAAGDKAKTGAAYLFERNSTGWVQTAKLTSPTPELADWFGWAVALEGETALIAAPVVLWMEHLRFGTVHEFTIPAQTRAYCFGAGCPCGNEDSVAGCENSTGHGGYLTACGTTGVAADDLVLTASSLPRGMPGVLVMGAGETTAPMGDGLLCISDGGVGVFRYTLQGAGDAGVISAGPGIVAESHALFSSLGQILVGQTWNFQVLYRDLGGSCGPGTNTTNAVAVTFSL